MATVQLPMPIVQPLQRIPEVIDISDDDDDIVITGHNPGRTQEAGPSTANNAHNNTRNPIFVLDSDDEQTGPSTFRGHSGHRSRLHRLVSPPPRNVQPQPIPPVPPIPRHLRGHRHAHAPYNLPPVVRPNPQPFPFEAHMDQPRRRDHTPPVLPPRGSARLAPSSSNGTWRRLPEHVARRAVPAWARAASGLWSAMGLPPILTLGEEADLWSQHDELFGVFDPERPPTKEQDVWKPSYTHPLKPQPGFVFDFNPGQSEASSAPSVGGSGSGTNTPRTIIILDDDDDEDTFVRQNTKETPVKTREFQVETSSELICANCQDVLVMSSGADVKTEEEQKNLRVWGLRCGHMLDGKCVNSLMHPKPTCVGTHSPPDGSEVTMADETESEFVTGKGKGKARATGASLPDSKGKGRAQDTPPSSQLLEQDSTLEGASPRYSLRPRRHVVSSLPPLLDAAATSPRPVRPLPRRRGGASMPSAKLKGKGRARKPTVEEEHEWMCPVVGCGHKHRSVRMSGDEKWIMAPNEGAIPLFV
ncbi:hypothetical protein NLI96_g1132 [Meripilus lineatus]|uniref:Uncharacterized protein n=1 Tax=Meripilus lineatus TaxID=2056292 RepID=A0AAD5YLD2_9APHY|nr:hypothetical protein NLI96_g1132 [Physisporinus lineatus]